MIVSWDWISLIKLVCKTISPPSEWLPGSAGSPRSKPIADVSIDFQLPIKPYCPPLPNAICRRIYLSETINLWKDHQRQKCFPVVGWSLRVIDIKKRWTERIPESKQDSTSNIFPLLVFLERRNKEMMVLVDPLSVANPRKRKMTPLPIPSRRGWCIYHF